MSLSIMKRSAIALLGFLMLLILPVSVFASDNFISFKGPSLTGMDVKSETTDKYFAPLSGVQVNSIDFSIQNEPSPLTSSGVLFAGKAKQSVITISKTVDFASPTLVSALAKGVKYQSATIYIRKQGLTVLEPYLAYTLSNVLVTNYSVSFTEGGDIPVEEIQLTYSAINMSYSKTDLKGALSPPTTATWNFSTNTVN